MSEIEKPTAKKNSGKPFEPTEQQCIVVRTLRSVGVTLENIALAIIDKNTDSSISIPTLKKHFPDELMNGKMYHLARIYNSLSNQALGGSTKACLAILVAQAPEEWGFTRHLKLASEVDDSNLKIIGGLPDFLNISKYKKDAEEPKNE